MKKLQCSVTDGLLAPESVRVINKYFHTGEVDKFEGFDIVLSLKVGQDLSVSRALARSIDYRPRGAPYYRTVTMAMGADEMLE